MQAYFSDQINPPTDPDRPDPPQATVAVYVDDIVIKTPRADDLIATLSATFANLKRFNIKLNPEKCTFGVPKGKLLGYMVSERGIEANRDKISAITNMGPIHGVKGVQRLTGCLAALSRFIARLGERGLPYTNSSRSPTPLSGRRRLRWPSTASRPSCPLPRYSSHQILANPFCFT